MVLIIYSKKGAKRMKVIVKAGTKTWFVEGIPEVAEFVQATPVEVSGPDEGGWYVTTEDVPGFPLGERVFLREESFDVASWATPEYMA